ncbi:hypothetical protein [Anaerococcus tetradius]|uniref:hypothetical protein n=1 Tax=Anaerococcus tetradius TaxID=33036 RepID=UPI0023F54226|nr:hypothetical protein [Anaerococcus tetradius]
MKNIRLNIAGFLGLILLVISFITPLLGLSTKLNTQIASRIINSYLIAYIAYMISFMDTRRVILIFLPLLFHVSLNYLIINGFSVKLSKDIIQGTYAIVRNLFDLISLVGIFFLLELILNKIFGNKFTSLVGLLSLAFFFYFDYSRILVRFTSLKEVFLYFSIFVMALRIRKAEKINPLLYILAASLVGVEIFLNYKYRLDYGYFLSFIPLVYLILKSIANPSQVSFEKFMIFTYLYIYPSIFIALRLFVGENRLVTCLLGLLSTLFIGQILYKLRIKYINYLLVGIN